MVRPYNQTKYKCPPGHVICCKCRVVLRGTVELPRGRGHCDLMHHTCLHEGAVYGRLSSADETPVLGTLAKVFDFGRHGEIADTTIFDNTFSASPVRLFLYLGMGLKPHPVVRPASGK